MPFGHQLLVLLEDDHDLYEVLKRVHLITGNESAEEKAKNPFHNLESYVAIEYVHYPYRDIRYMNRPITSVSEDLIFLWVNGNCSCWQGRC